MRDVMVAQGSLKCRSRTEEAALGMNDLARDPGRLITGQERHDPRRVLGLPDPPRRERRCDLPLQLLGHPARVRRARVDGVHRDALVPNLRSEGPELKLTILPPGPPGYRLAKPTLSSAMARTLTA